jgi:hypothetical protein
MRETGSLSHNRRHPSCIATAVLLPGCGTVTSNPPYIEPESDCPANEPMNGEACYATSVCSYAASNSCGPGSNSATCNDGIWNVQWDGPTCEPEYCVYATEAECTAVADCRWLVPGCDMPALPEAGCFPNADCTTDMDYCAAIGKTCGQASINPCYNLACDACGMTVSVCLPPAGP